VKLLTKLGDSELEAKHIVWETAFGTDVNRREAETRAALWANNGSPPASGKRQKD